MFAIGAATQIFLATGATDLRKGCNGLFALVRARWDRDALSGEVSLFCNRRREALKIFFWSVGAMWGCAARLERDGVLDRWNGTRSKGQDLRRQGRGDGLFYRIPARRGDPTDFRGEPTDLHQHHERNTEMNCYCLLVSVLVTFATAQLGTATPEVTNIRASQRAGTKLIDVYYDLADSDSSSVFISVQLYDDATPLPSFAVTGAVGSGITPGANKLIVWNAGQDWNRRFTTKGKVRIIADDLSTVSPSATVAYVPAGFGKPEGSSYEVYSSGFFMDKTEVSQQLWSTVYAWAVGNGYSFDNVGVATNSAHPVAGISWYDAVKWCNARSEKEGLNPVYYTNNLRTTVYRTGQITLNNDCATWTANGYRLPTRAEWIKAYWGGNTSGFYPWASYGGSAGNHINGGMANYYASGDPFESSNPNATTPVSYYSGSQTPTGPDNRNGYGLYDMVGNVGEWCWDRSFSGWYSLVESRDDNSKGPSAGLGTTRCFSGLYEDGASSTGFFSQPYVSSSTAYSYPTANAYNNYGRYDLTHAN